jgi:hypothetical protein
MLAIFVAGIIIACVVDFSTVPSRIATGLISGAMVGMLSSLVNYYYAWQSYIGGIYDSTFELFSELGHEVNEAKTTVKMVDNSSQQSAVSWLVYLSKKMDESEKEGTSKYHDYTKYRLKFNSDQYTSFFSLSKTKSALDMLKFQVEKLGLISSYRFLCHLAVNLEVGHFPNKEMELETIGDRDEFYEYIKQGMIDWRDYTACMMRELCNNIQSLQDTIKPFILGKDYKELPNILFGLKDKYLENLPDRNPLYEKKEEADDDENVEIEDAEDSQVDKD